MSDKNWATRIIWFILGVVVATSVSVAHARRTTPEPQPLTVEERVTKLEQSVKDLWEAMHKKEDTKKWPSNDR